jgi:SAM-dependent methyltransferase
MDFNMYELMQDISQRPEPFSRYTAMELWTRPHLARQMLDFHLDQKTDLASHRFEAIDQIVNWIDSQLVLSDKRVCDLGCGPGLYTQRFASFGADVTGVDFSAHSLQYARLKAGENEQAITYLEADYLSDDLPASFDVVTLIYTDFCVLSPTQRVTLLGRIREMLNPGGSLVMDAAGMGSFEAKEEFTLIEDKLMFGFWAKGDYVGIHRAFVYPEEGLSLDRYVIIEPTETWQIFNWFQYFTPESLETELNAAGFSVEQMVGDLTGKPPKPDGDFIGVIASTS